MLESIAILDDSLENLKRWETAFCDVGIRVSTFSQRSEFVKSLERGDYFDVIILDWFFELPDDSTQARLILEADLRNKRFVPVCIFTDESDLAQDECSQLDPPFNTIPVLSKSDYNPTRLQSHIEKWYGSSTSGRLATLWRKARSRGLEESLYALTAIDGADLQRSLQHVLKLDAGDTPDINHAFDFLERFVSRKVLADGELRAALRSELDQARLHGVSPKGNREKALIHSHRYVPIDIAEKAVQTGDIVKVLRSDGDNNPLIGIVVTPSCDLDNRKCTELRLLQMSPFEGGRSPDKLPASEVHLPHVAAAATGPFQDYVACFHRAFFVHDLAMEQQKSNGETRAIAYNHDFADAFGGRLRLAPIVRLDDPYRADLLQKFASHASRIGIP